MFNFYFIVLQLYVLSSIIVRVSGVRFGSNNIKTQDDSSKNHRQLHSLVHEEVRSRKFMLPLDRPAREKGEIVEFELFDGEIVHGEVSHVFHHGDTSTSWHGVIIEHNTENSKLHAHIKSKEIGHFGLSCVKSACTAEIQIYTSNKQFMIDSSGEPLNEEGHGIYKISEVNLQKDRRSGTLKESMVTELARVRAPEELENAKENHNLRPNLQSNSMKLLVDTDLIHDILVIYTPEALALAGRSI